MKLSKMYLTASIAITAFVFTGALACERALAVTGRKACAISFWCTAHSPMAQGLPENENQQVEATPQNL